MPLGIILVFFITVLNAPFCGATDFNQAFAVSVVSSVEKLIALPWTRINNILFSAFNSRWEYLYSGDDVGTAEGPNYYIDFVDANHTREFLWSLFKPFEYEESSSIDTIYCGFENGMFIGYSSPAPGSLFWQTSGNNSCPEFGVDERCREYYAGGSSADSTTGKISGPITSVRVYDPRWRPWYKLSQLDGEIWTNPYIFTQLQVLGITAAKQIVTDSGEFIGVIGTDYTLATLETALASLIEKSDEFFIFIVDNDGMMIAASESGVAVDDNLQQIQANQSTNSLVSQVAQVIEKSTNEGGVGGWVKANGTVMTVEIDGKGLYWAQSNEITDEYGLRWHMVVIEQTVCEPGTYILNKEQTFAKDTSTYVVCGTCPEGAYCPGGNHLPYPKPGYWSDLDTTLIKPTMHECVRNTCDGFKKRANRYHALSYERLLDLCFVINSEESNSTHAASACNVNDLLCDEGSTGPMCGSCKHSYRYSAVSRTCVECNSRSIMSYLILIVLVGMILLISLLRLVKVKVPFLSKVSKSLWNSWIVMILRSLFKTGSLKVMISTYQIIQSAGTSLEIDYPDTFSVSLRYMSFLSFDTPGLDCSGIGVYDRVYIASIVPLVIAFFIVIIGEIRLISARSNRKQYADHVVVAKCNRIKSQHAWALLFLSYLVLPPVAGKQLKAIDCFKIPNSDGQLVLRIDTAVSCNSNEHRQFQFYDSLMIVFYLGIPVLWLLLLHSQRRKLFPVGIKDDAIIMQRRKLEDSLIRLKFLFERYRPSMYFFESVDVIRRILLVGVLPLLASSSLMRAAIGAGISLLFLIMNRELSPYVSEETNLVAYIADIVIYLTFASALMIETGLDNGLNSLIFGLIMIFVNISILATAVTAAVFRTSLDREQRHRRKEKYLKQVEDASDYTSHNFAATFHEINRTVITPSHCSLLFYASLTEIKHILRHGIPVCDKFVRDGGIVFTMHQPHSLDNEDRRVFKSTEAFLVVSLPRRLLRQYGVNPVVQGGINGGHYVQQTTSKSFDIQADRHPATIAQATASSVHSALWCLPLGVLKAMRGTYFDDIIDATLWRQGVLLLPPQCIKRAYHLVGMSSNDATNTTDAGDRKGTATQTQSNRSTIKHSRHNGKSQPWVEGGASVFALPEGFAATKRRLSMSEKKEEYRDEETDGIALMGTSTDVTIKSPGLSATAVPLTKESIEAATEASDLKLHLYEREHFPVRLNHPVEVSNIDTYLSLMSQVRKYCSQHGFIPLYHYTQVELATMIIKGGFKMSSEGQGDGGVYFSTFGPASYDIGSPHYEENVIIDCFGREKLDSMRGSHLVDMCIVYAVDPLVVEKVTDTVHHNSMIIPQEYFQDFSLSNPDGSYFLRSDRNLTCFCLDFQKMKVSGLDASRKKIELERIKDMEMTQLMLLKHREKKLNEKLIGSLLSEVSPQVHIEWAVTYGATKFNTVLKKLEKSFLNSPRYSGTSEDYSLYFHYGTLAAISTYVRCGVPVLKQSSTDSKGAFFTKHHPDELSDDEIQLFGSCEAFVACLLPTKLLFSHTAKKKRMSSNDMKVIAKVRSLRNEHSIIDFEKSGKNNSMSSLKSDLYYLPSEVLSAMRGCNFEKLLDPQPWYDGLLLLPPQTIKAAFQVISEENIDATEDLGCVLSAANCAVDKPLHSIDDENDKRSTKRSSAAEIFRNPMAPPSEASTVSSTSSNQPLVPEEETQLVETPSVAPLTLRSIEPYTSTLSLRKQLDAIQKKCRENGLTPLYYYTDDKSARFILQNGFKVSLHSNGALGGDGSEDGESNVDGGVYFTTKSPLDYNLDASRHDEDKIIQDFFGSGVVEEYQNKNKVDICLVYGMSDMVVEDECSFKKRKPTTNLDQAIVESVNNDDLNSLEDEKEVEGHLKVLPRSYFRDFCLLSEDNSYYLRNDRIMGAFLLISPKPLSPKGLPPPPRKYRNKFNLPKPSEKKNPKKKKQMIEHI